MQGRKYFCRIVLKTLGEGHLEEMENTESAAVELVDFLRRIIRDTCTEVGLRLTPGFHSDKEGTLKVGGRESAVAIELKQPQMDTLSSPMLFLSHNLLFL